MQQSSRTALGAVILFLTLRPMAELLYEAIQSGQLPPVFAFLATNPSVQAMLVAVLIYSLAYRRHRRQMS